MPEAAARARRSPAACARRATRGSPRSTATARTIRPTCPKLLDALRPGRRAPGLALVAGWRTARHDSAVRRLSSRIANGVRARLLGDATPDTGCGLKVFPRELFLRLPFFDHLHRFLPALVLREGGQVVSVPVSHRARAGGHIQVRHPQPAVGRHRRPVRRDVAAAPCHAAGHRAMNLHSITLPEWVVLAVGFGGQALFSARFIIQWLASERAGRSVMPDVFWYFSLAGGATLFVYAVYREDPVFMLGQGMGLFIYARNLWLIRRERRGGVPLAPHA